MVAKMKEGKIMSEKKKMKKRDIKIYVVFGVIMFACLMVGFLVGRLGSNLQEQIDSIDWVKLATYLYMPSSILFAAIVIVVYGISFVFYTSAKKQYDRLITLDDETFEDGIYDVELILSKSMTVAVGVFMSSFLCFPLVLLCSETVDRAGLDALQAGNIIAELCFILSLVLYLSLASLVVTLEKKINPEKKGNVFDIHFMKKWLGSMDEAELMKTARASQKAYFAGVVTCMIMWAISLISMLMFHTGLLPILCITVIMIVMVITGEIKAR